MTKGLTVLTLVGFLLGGCQKGREPEPAKQAEAPKASAEPALAFPGKAPPEMDPAELPGPQGPFVEPPLRERPREIHHVVAGYPEDPQGARKLLDRLETVKAIPVGYPAVDQSRGLGGPGGKWVVLAGKFARPGYARVLLEVLKKAGFEEAAVVPRGYRHDRFRPAINQAAGTKIGVVFAGLAGMQVPLLAGPASSASGTGATLKDGDLVEVSTREETEEGVWHKIRARQSGKPLEGYLPAARLLTDYNVFPSSSGRRAVLGVSLGCQAGKCRWDYWMVGRGMEPRKLLAAAAERLPHAFSPDGSMLAYAPPLRSLSLAFEGKDSEVVLSAGTSPSWDPGGKLVYFRKAGLAIQRDEVMVAGAPDWKVKKVLDFKGNPHYPKALSVIPPAVDVRANGQRLYTMFYRLVKKDGVSAIHRWKVLFTPEGKIVSKKGEQITE